MGSESPAPLVEKDNVVVDASVSRACSRKKNHGKVPKRIHKAERERLKREQLNDLFLDLANVIELTQQNNGKASILSEAARLLKDLLGQIECLKKENSSLLSESNYVAVEKNELKEENSALETQIEKLQSELEVRVAQSKPDLNVPPPSEFQQPELTSHLPGNCFRLPAVEPSLQQAPPAVFVLPLHPDLQGYPVSDFAHFTSKPTPNVSKPHARYPTPADSWPSQLLGEQPTAAKEFQLRDSNSSICSTGEGGPRNI